MFTFLFEKSVRAQVWSTRKHSHLEARWAIVGTNQAMVTDDRGERGPGAGSSDCEGGRQRMLMSFHFFWRSKTTLHSHPRLFFSFLPPRAKTLAPRRLWAARTLVTSTISRGVGPAWPGTDWRQDAFSCWRRLTHAFISPLKPIPTCKEANAHGE